MACILRYYSAWGGTNPGVGVAYSEFPSGPFRDVLGGPVMPGNDPTIFIDPDDPSVRVLCSNVRPDQSLGNYGPLCGTLANDMVTWEQQPAIMAGFNKTTWRFFEAPWLHKMDDKYYLSFMMEGTEADKCTQQRADRASLRRRFAGVLAFGRRGPPRASASVGGWRPFELDTYVGCGALSIAYCLRP